MRQYEAMKNRFSF